MIICFFLLIIGFNCGEAVNFATDDWFPFGAAASRRYALLRMMPLIPYEELLCKEAMLVYKSSSRVRSSKNKPEDKAPYKAIVQPFLHLMQFYMTSLLRLKSSRNLQSYSNTSGLLICRICHRDCYVAYLLCKYCFSHPICLFHGRTSQYIHFENCYFNCFQWHLRCRLRDALLCVNIQFVWKKMIWFLMTCFFFGDLFIMACRDCTTHLYMWKILLSLHKEWHFGTGRSCQKFSTEKSMLHWNILCIKFILLQQKWMHQTSWGMRKNW